MGTNDYNDDGNEKTNNSIGYSYLSLSFHFDFIFLPFFYCFVVAIVAVTVCYRLHQVIQIEISWMEEHII